MDLVHCNNHLSSSKKAKEKSDAVLCTYAGILYGDCTIMYSNTSEATENITRRLSLCLLKGSLSEHFQAVTADEVTRLARSVTSV